jgi:hypothetical protein
MRPTESLIPRRLEAVPSPKLADEKTLRMCFSEQDAISASIALSGLTYREIAARMGKSRSLVNAMAKGERELTRKNTNAFCHATGTLLICQYREMRKAMDAAMGRVRERDRMDTILAPTQHAWRQAA